MDILILHVDSLDSAQENIRLFRNAGYSASHLNPQASNMSEQSLRECIDDYEAIAILVSKGLFASRLIRFGIGYALGKALPLVSIIDPDNEPLVPSWYRELFPKEYSGSEIITRLRQLKV